MRRARQRQGGHVGRLSVSQQSRSCGRPKRLWGGPAGLPAVLWWAGKRVAHNAPGSHGDEPKFELAPALRAVLRRLVERSIAGMPCRQRRRLAENRVSGRHLPIDTKADTGSPTRGAPQPAPLAQPHRGSIGHQGCAAPATSSEPSACGARLQRHLAPPQVAVGHQAVQQAPARVADSAFFASVCVHRRRRLSPATLGVRLVARPPPARMPCAHFGSWSASGDLARAIQRSLVPDARGRRRLVRRPGGSLGGVSGGASRGHDTVSTGLGSRTAKSDRYPISRWASANA